MELLNEHKIVDNVVIALKACFMGAFDLSVDGEHFVDCDEIQSG